jgi:thioesterase domain-containing protein
VFPYYDLAAQMGASQPFYGLQSVGVDPAQEPHLSVEEMAAAYIQAIRTVQPDGPYHLGGWSLGSLVAFEMAQQLQLAGQPVGSLILLDTSAPDAVQGNISPIAAAAFFLTIMPRFIWPYVADYGYLLTQGNREAQPPVPGLLRVLLRRARMASVLRDNARPMLTRQPLLKRMLYVMGVNIRVGAAYRAQAYPHRLTLLHTGQHSADPTLGWGSLAAGGVDVRAMAGNHFSLLRQPHVQRVAHEIRDIIDASSKT